MLQSPCHDFIPKLKSLYHQYPRQCWLMITGIVLSTAGGSMIRLDLPLSTAATLISINAGTGLVSSFLAGSLADRIGRKGVMIFSLTVIGKYSM